MGAGANREEGINFSVQLLRVCKNLDIITSSKQVISDSFLMDHRYLFSENDTHASRNLLCGCRVGDKF